MGRSKPKEYANPETGEQVPSVTAVIGAYQEAGWKGHIGHVYSRWTAQECVRQLENYALTGSMPVVRWVEKDGERAKRHVDLAKAEGGAAKAMEDHLAKHPFGVLDAKADAGSLVHAVIDQFRHGPERGDLPGLLRDLWDESRAGPEPWRLTEAEAAEALVSCERAWDWCQERVDEWLPSLGRLFGETAGGYGYCGEIDALVTLKGEDGAWLPDWKSGAKSGTHAVQVTAYLGLLPKDTAGVKGIVVYVGGQVSKVDPVVAYDVHPDRNGPRHSPRAKWEAVLASWYASRSEAGWLEKRI